MKLSRIVITLMFAGIVGIVLYSPGVHAYSVSVGEYISFEFAYGNEYRPVFGIYGRGGAFGVYNTSDKFLFNTFCLETNEYITLGHPYLVQSIGGNAIANGSDISKGYQATYGGDPLDSRTAYLYSRFMAGTLDLHGYIKSDSIVANALQRAIWFIEQEYQNTKKVSGNWTGEGDWTNPTYYLGNDATGDLAYQFFLDAESHSIKGNLYGVQVLNMYDGNKQSMLVVPEPGILILLGIAMSAIGAASWRLRKL